MLFRSARPKRPLRPAGRPAGGIAPGTHPRPPQASAVGGPLHFPLCPPPPLNAVLRTAGWELDGSPLLHTCCVPFKACVDQGSVFRAIRLTSGKPTRAGTSHLPTFMLPHGMSTLAHSHLPDWRRSKWPVWWFNTCFAHLVNRGGGAPHDGALIHTPIVSTPLASRVLYGNGGGQG